MNPFAPFAARSRSLPPAWRATLGARQRKSRPCFRQRGNTLAGFVIGLLVGLGLAVAVALFVTKTPVPSVNRGGQAPARPANLAPLPPGERIPDPNASLYPKDPPPVVHQETPATGAPAEAGTASASTSFEQAFLQAGAFKATADAENLQARLALLGLEARVSTVTREGETLYRVRVGPYARSDDIARVRQRLTENGITPTLIPVNQ